MQRIAAPERWIFALRALRPVLVEVERKRNDFALFHQLGRRNDVLRLRVVQGADLVVGAPLAPVLVFFRGGTQVVSSELAGRHEPSFSSAASPRTRRRPRPLARNRDGENR